MWAEKKSSQSLAEWLIWFPCTSEESGRGGVWVISWNFLWQPLGGWVNNGHQRKQLLRNALSSPLDGPILSPIPGILKDATPASYGEGPAAAFTHWIGMAGRPPAQRRLWGPNGSEPFSRSTRVSAWPPWWTFCAVWWQVLDMQIKSSDVESIVRKMLQRIWAKFMWPSIRWDFVPLSRTDWVISIGCWDRRCPTRWENRRWCRVTRRWSTCKWSTNRADSPCHPAPCAFSRN